MLVKLIQGRSLIGGGSLGNPGGAGSGLLPNTGTVSESVSVAASSGETNKRSSSMTDKGIVLVEVEGHVVSTHDAGLEQVVDINRSISSQSTSAINAKAINVAKKVNTDTQG